ncbi:MAG: hypothetical protein WDO15_30825 [Bacteroidota bacterium]
METSLTSKSFFSADKKLTFLLLVLATYVLLYIKVAYIEYETAAFEFLADPARRRRIAGFYRTEIYLCALSFTFGNLL